MPPVRRLLPVCFLLGGASLISGNMSNKYPPFGDCLPFMEYKNAKSQLQWRRGKMGVFITCNTNYTLSGSNFMEVYCLEGRWRLEIGVSPSKCERHCMAPPPLDKGMLDPKSYSPNGTYLDGSTVYYLCNKEFYQNIRPAYLVCEAGIWTGPVIHCLYAGPSWCYPPEIIPHGYHIAPRVYRQVFQIDEQINYGCKKRYHLVGADTITCTSTGEWHPPPPSCLLKSGNPFADFSAPAVANGMPDFFAQGTPGQTMWAAPQQPAAPPFGDLTGVFNTTTSSVFDPMGPAAPSAPAQPPQRPPQPSKILTGDLESSLNSLVENLTMDSGGGKWNSPKNQPRSSGAVGWQPQLMATTNAASYRPMTGAQPQQQPQTVMQPPFGVQYMGAYQPPPMTGSPKIGETAAPPQEPFDPFGAL